MRGFFDSGQTGRMSAYKVKGRPTTCASCGLYRNVLSPRMDPHGKGGKGVLVIGEAPGEIEDKKGRQWQGPVGRKLQRYFKELGFNLFRDCVCTNAVNCRPTQKGGNRAPTDYEIDCCRQRVWKVIREFKPKVILLFGNPAVQSFLGHRWKKDLGGINKWRGWTIPDREVGAWVCPIFHPSYVERTDNRAVKVLFKRDLKRALGMIDVPFPKFTDEREQIRIIDAERLVEEIHKVIHPDRPRVLGPISIDYETTGLKPHAKGHRIVCGAIAVYKEGSAAVDELGYPTIPKSIHGLAFMIPPTRKGRKQLKIFLEETYYLKTAHNAKFELAWSTTRLRAQPRGFVWDSMLAAHVLDNRDGITGLKFQSYVNFGVLDYDSHIAPYLRSTSSKAGGNGFNRVLDLVKGQGGRDELLRYCGLDAIYGLMLTLKQRREILW